MLRFYVDFNQCEDVDVVVIQTHVKINSEIDIIKMIEGERVLLYDESLECEAILRKVSGERWVAELDRRTRHEIPEDQWNRLSSRF